MEDNGIWNKMEDELSEIKNPLTLQVNGLGVSMEQ